MGVKMTNSANLLSESKVKRVCHRLLPSVIQCCSITTNIIVFRHHLSTCRGSLSFKYWPPVNLCRV